jgi:hypothetical protein
MFWREEKVCLYRVAAGIFLTLPLFRYQLLPYALAKIYFLFKKITHEAAGNFAHENDIRKTRVKQWTFYAKTKEGKVIP